MSSRYLKFALLASLGLLSIVFLYRLQAGLDTKDVTPAKAGQASASKNSAPEGFANTSRAEAGPSAVETQTFEDSLDFGLLLAQAIPKAETGDADAANLVAKIYDHCLPYSVSGPRFSEAVDFEAKQNPQAATAIRQAAARIEKRCRLVSGGEAIGVERVAEWNGRAAQLGSVEARVRQAVRSPGELTSGLKGIVVSDALLSGDPSAIFEAADLVHGLSESDVPEALAGLVGGDVNLYAWKVAACRMGTMCRSGSPYMDGSCVTGGACDSSGLEFAIRNGAVPNASWDAVELRVAQIRKFVGN